MNFSMPCLIPNNLNGANPTHKPYKTLEDAIFLVKAAIQGEKEDELFYDYLISIAPTHEDKSIIKSIRDDEKKHNKYFREIYQNYTGKTISLTSNVNFEKPDSYIDGLKKAKLDELSAVKKYRDIMAGIPDKYYSDMIFEILTDELIHAHKDDYLLSINLTKCQVSAVAVTPEFTTKFTINNAVELAKALGINFDEENFDINQFLMGLNTELEHGKKSPETNISNDDPLITAKIALAHLREFPDYYTRLAKLEDEAKAFWKTHSYLIGAQSRFL